ncbi:MAG: NifU family protein [Syntrophobacteraceae bacterium]|jgi:Fe-S cluster biogenesis protein NfuA
MYRSIENIIETEIRPRLQAHGGDIELLGVGDDGTVRVRLIGKCATCPASQSTVENLVETVLREKIPWIKRIIVSQSVSDELIGEALKFLRKGQSPA